MLAVMGYIKKNRNQMQISTFSKRPLPLMNSCSCSSSSWHHATKFFEINLLLGLGKFIVKEKKQKQNPTRIF
jgi:hypothetical protein